MNDYDYENLRNDLRDYFFAATTIFDIAYADVIRVDAASDDELLLIANECGFDLNDYIISYRL